MEVRNYETVFILTPVLSEQQTEDAVAKFRSIITDNGGDIYHSESWGLKKLAYPIQNKVTGFYQLFEFKASPELIRTLEVEFKRDERILRFLTVFLDKYGVEYNDRRKGQAASKKKQEKEEVAS